MRFGVLGPLAVWTRDGREVHVPERKVRTVLAVLLAGRLDHPRGPVSADRLAAALWRGRLPVHPDAVVQTKVSQLRRVFADAEPGGRGLVPPHLPGGYLLRAEAADVDAEVFADLLARARRAEAAEAAALLGRALELWRGPAFAGMADDDALRPAADRLEELRLEAVERLAEARLDLGEHHALAGELGELAARHPLRERLRAAHIRALYLAGRQHDALAAYTGLQRRLSDELGVDPGPELSALHRSILRHELVPGPGPPAPGAAWTAPPAPGTPAGAAPPAAAVRARTNLPAPLTRLVGRDADVAQVRALLGTERLVTLTGPGGVGKTRLAVAAAHGLTEAHPGGVWIVDLTALCRAADPGTPTVSLVSDLVAETLGVRDEPTHPVGGGAAAGLITAAHGPREGPAASAPGHAAADMTADRLLTALRDLRDATAPAERDTAADRLVATLREGLSNRTPDRPETGRTAERPLTEAREDPGGDAPGQEDETAADRLVAALRGRRTLLVLDNCEHVIGPVAELAGRLLPAVPDLRVLATSQEPLALAGEVLRPVPPLPVPEPSAQEEPEALLRFGAVRLFVERAAAAAPGFVFDRRSAPAVAAVCRRLDGVPLALELAATRLRALDAAELAARLDDRFRLLSAGSRDAPDRQRSLQAVIDWSCEPLTGPERAVLRRLAVHADGCVLAAAEEVCAGGPVASADVLGLLTRLVDRSLVAVVPGADGPRYRLLESIAAYGVDRMREAGELDAVRRRHRGHYTRLAAAGTRLDGPGRDRWLRRLDAESANLRAALDAALADGDHRAAQTLVSSLTRYWTLRGRHHEARRARDRVAGAPDTGADRPHPSVSAAAAPRG
ncbi:AfsR/SARP family transcriptional regulator [Allonocardiopsis opalescens]|uniref:Putative ATPase n=1 Tax=Allonocardiopsis opalescens TaxID=1144618 RepID=A0A2T0Q2Y6_9ACTN|nr:BTAD domain-containing putative transcriptional regulator [Allonocardiopsis opalescens]PRX98155.1 putative ATPase [Allonocardiopsis opalescens]